MISAIWFVIINGDDCIIDHVQLASRASLNFAPVTINQFGEQPGQGSGGY